MEGILPKLVTQEFFDPCVFHDEYCKRFFCLKSHTSFCQACYPDRDGIKVYRNMYNNVLRIDEFSPHHMHMFAGIQVFRSNHHRTIHLQPHKTLVHKKDPERKCPCGRSVLASGTVKFCSLSCKVCLTLGNRRRKMTPHHSPYE